jgi:hypothetical protein
MRIWLVGAGERGTEALRQLSKNRNLEIVVSDPTDQPPALQAGIVTKIDHKEVVTSVNINTLARRIRPDLILIDSGADQSNLGRLTGGVAFAAALNSEIAAASEYPCIVL